MQRQLPMAGDITLVSRMTGLLLPLLAGSAIAGLTLGPRGWYDAAATTYPSFLGQDAITLTLGVPMLAASAWAGRHGSTRALFCWIGLLFYVAYAYAFYVLGAPVTWLFPVYIVIVSLGMYGALALLFALDLPALEARAGPRLPRRTVAAYFVATATFFAGLWLMLVASRLAAGDAPDMVVRTVVAIDGIVLLPLLFFGGLWLWRRTALGLALAGPLLMKAAATFLTLIANTLIVVAWGHAVSAVETAAYVTGFLVAAFLLARFLVNIEEDLPCTPEPSSSGGPCSSPPSPMALSARR